MRLLGFDVDESGRWVAVGYLVEEADDAWLRIHDSSSGDWFDIDSTPFMGTHIRGNARCVRWANGAQAVELFSNLDNAWHLCPLDLAARTVQWS